MEGTRTVASELSGWSRIEKEHLCLENRLAKLEERQEGQDLVLRKCNLIINLINLNLKEQVKKCRNSVRRRWSHSYKQSWVYRGNQVSSGHIGLEERGGSKVNYH